MKQVILNAQSIHNKLKRMATQIVEQNYEEQEIVLLGIQERGYYIAELLALELQQFNIKVALGSITLNKVNPLASPIEISLPQTDWQNKCIIMVDDVANSGKTLFYAMKPLMEVVVQKIQVAVLVDRQHKLFPIAPDIIGHSLSTTLQERIDVEIGKDVIDPSAYIS